MSEIKPPCPYADMSDAETDDWGRLNAPCRLLDDDRVCPYVACDRAACKLCPLPAYHVEDPVTRLMEAGFPGLLDDLAEVGDQCLCSCDARNNHFYLEDECVQRISKPDPKTKVRACICPSAASQLRLMYLGAEWRRRKSNQDN